MVFTGVLWKIVCLEENYNNDMKEIWGRYYGLYESSLWKKQEKNNRK